MDGVLWLSLLTLQPWDAPVLLNKLSTHCTVSKLSHEDDQLI